MPFKSKWLLAFLVFFSLVTFLVAYFFYLLKSPASLARETKIFQVKEGSGVGKIAADLKSQGLINSTFVFKVYVYFKGYAPKIQAGTYELNTGLTIPEIAKILATGQVKKIVITIPEGWRLKEIANYLEKEKIVTAKDFVAEASNLSKYKKEFPFLDSLPYSANLEGFLFPDTYQLAWGATSEEIIKKMLENFQKKVWSPIQNHAQNSHFDLFKLITLASIVEKEASDFNERRIIAGIFYKRLELGMKLESCATVAYVLESKKRILSAEDLKTPSPYNTYLHYGLPPGPICSPGLEAIKATLDYQKTDYLYFLSTPEGKTIFSKTYEEHLQAKNKYLK